MDDKYSLENKKKYIEKESLLPNTEVNYIIKKISLIEELFKNKEVNSIIPAFSLSFDSYNSICFEQNIEILWENNCEVSNSLYHDIDNILMNIKEIDKEIADFIIINDYYNYEDNASLRKKMEIEVISAMNNFLVNNEISRENRCELYKDNNLFLKYFSQPSKKYFEQYVETLKNNKLYIPHKIELYGNEFSVIPTDFKDFQIQSFQRMMYYKKNYYFEEIKDFIVESFNNLENYNGILSITIDGKNQNISSVYTNKKEKKSILNYDTKLFSFSSSVKKFKIDLKNLTESLNRNIEDIIEFAQVKNHDFDIPKIANDIEILINKNILNSTFPEQVNNKIYKNRL